MKLVGRKDRDRKRLGEIHRDRKRGREKERENSIPTD